MARRRTARTPTPRAPRWEHPVVEAHFEADGARYRAVASTDGLVSVYPEGSSHVAFRGWWMKGQGIDHTHDLSRHWYDAQLPEHPRGQRVAFARIVNAASLAIHEARMAQLRATRENPAHRRRSVSLWRGR